MAATELTREWLEKRWDEAGSPSEMLSHLMKKEGPASHPAVLFRRNRRFRLFACACCRSGIPLSQASVYTVDLAENYADGRGPLPDSTLVCCASQPQVAAANAAERYCRDVSNMFKADLLRDVFGNPWRPLTIQRAESIKCRKCGGHGQLEVEGKGLTACSRCSGYGSEVVRAEDWVTETAVQLARAAYDDRHYPSGHFQSDLLGILADQLEDAGCDKPWVLEHLRSPKPHVRGCWVVDQILELGR
jgi:ribosomal protein L37E